jgi:hypothetical protein
MIRPSSSCADERGKTDVRRGREERETHDVGHLTERLLGDKGGGLMLLFKEVDGVEFIRDVLLVEDDGGALRGRRALVTVELEDHRVVGCDGDGCMYMVRRMDGGRGLYCGRHGWPRAFVNRFVGGRCVQR